MLTPILNTVPIVTLSLPAFQEKKVQVSVMRLDLVHPLISGNKWFKLRFYLEDARQRKKNTIITFGGAWSNHILASAAACQLAGFKKSIGIIRGERPVELSPTLLAAQELGMQLLFVSRSAYGEKKIPATPGYDNHYLIPEGGYGEQGADGAATILEHCEKMDYTHIVCACGTGTMLAGLLRSALPEQQMVGISVLKNNHDLDGNVRTLSRGNNRFGILHDYHFGGYAKHQPALISFMNDFYRDTGVPSDFVYTGKLFFGVNDLAIKQYFSPGDKLLVIHSGGLQGNASLPPGTLIF
jgi:1-aminocyclopropane-1-carboxylate deaminase